MPATDIRTVDWWCFAHERSKEMMWRDGRWVMVCGECDMAEKKEKEKKNG